MKRIVISMFTFVMIATPAFSATWVAADRVATVGETLISKNNLPAKTTFKVVNGVADNSATSTTNVIQISSTDLSYTGNDNEVAAVIATEMGYIINGKSTKEKFRSIAKAAIAEKLASDNIINTAANSTYIANKTNLNDSKTADITGADLMIKAGYNPLARIVVTTKMPGSTLEAVQGKPANTERAMNVFDYLTYNYPEKIKAGYNCQEYRAFLDYANPIVEDRNASKKKLDKFNKQQAKNKAQRAKEISQYKATGGVSGWDASYAILQSLTQE